MSFSFTRQAVISAVAAVAFAAAFPQAGFAAGNFETGMWKVNTAQSKLGAGHNTLVIERTSSSAKATQNLDGAANTSGAFLVISKGKVYLATAEDAYAATASGIKPIDYSAWKGMKLVEVGDRVRIADYCNFRCQSGLRDNRITLTFIAKNADAMKQPMRDIVVLNK